MTVASVLKGKDIARRVSLGVGCGSRQVQQMLARNGALADIVDSGARILENVCGFCIGNSMAPKTDAVSLRTNNRNFEGRSGTKSANVYLVSPETAVASALAGEVVDPREYFAKAMYPKVALPKRFTIDDSMVVQPPEHGDTQVVRGPNIGEPPSSEPCPDTIKGVVTIKVGDKITTDHISPAGSRLKYRSNIAKYAEFVFERTDPQFHSRALQNKERGVHNVIAAGESYGQGSSREHAAICPMFLGVRMVIAVSIERIHKANLVNFGIVPALFAEAEAYTGPDKDDALEVNDLRRAVDEGDTLTLKNTAKNTEIALRLELSERERRYLLAGGLINAVRGDS
jgi:aconitate hydratase